MLRETVDVALGAPLIVVLQLPFLAGFVVCGGSPEQEAAAAEIIDFEPQKGAIRPGTPATVSVRIKNTGAEDRTLCIVYSVQDLTGGWHDAPANPVELAAGEESDIQELSTEPLETPGYYNARVSIWSEEPKGEKTGEVDDTGGEARRLADAEEVSVFRISSTQEDFDRPELDPDQRASTTRDLGRGALAPQNVTVENGQLRLTLPANTLDGGEIESKALYGPGFYAARIKVPNAPSSITFYVDGEPIKEYEGGLPDKPMKLYVNSWFPKWLDGEKPDSDRYAYVDWIEY